MSSLPYLLYFLFKIISYMHIKKKLKESILSPTVLSFQKPLSIFNTLYHSILFHFIITTPYYTPYLQNYKHILYSNKQISFLHLFNHHNTFYLSLSFKYNLPNVLVSNTCSPLSLTSQKPHFEKKSIDPLSF